MYFWVCFFIKIGFYWFLVGLVFKNSMINIIVVIVIVICTSYIKKRSNSIFSYYFFDTCARFSICKDKIDPRPNKNKE